MKVAFDSRPVNDPRGIGRYTRCILDALRETAGGNELVEAVRPRGADVFHSPWIDGVRVRTACPQVVTLHDLVPLKRRSEYLRTGMRFRLRYMAVERAQRIIVPSEVVARDAVEHLHIDEERIVVIPEAAAPAMHPSTEDEVAGVRERYGLPDQYLLWVGGLEHPDPRKRVSALAETPRDMPLVLVGPTKPWAHDLPDVTLTGLVSDEDLAAIYTGARSLVIASDDEGFGLPTVEALACGTPVVACDVPALREHFADQVTFVERDDLRSLLATAALATRPAPDPPAWTWHDAADATWATYRAAVG
ncbi:MAG: glycosyltransferase [Solirubrobacteraceae bacterium]